MPTLQVWKSVAGVRWYSKASGLNDVVIASAVRTPIGSFLGSLATLPATKLGSVAISGAVKKAGIDPAAVNEVYMGNVLQGGQGQAPCRQATLGAGLPITTPTSTINKVCASGMKAIMLAAQNLMCGHQSVMVAGGMESMSNVPYYVKRGATPYGGFKVEDAITYDGLTDAYNHCHMGNCAENTAKKFSIGREEQDEYAVRSYKLSQQSAKDGLFKAEIVDVPVPQRKVHSSTMASDPERTVVIVSAVRTPIGSFQGSLSSVTASKLGSVVIAEAVKRAGLKPGDIEEVYMGQVLPAGGKQSTCKQAALGAGLPTSVPTTTINKRCASGMKAVMMAAQNIMCGGQSVMVAGGMESMSNVPYYIKRGATPYGGFQVEDGILCDGLLDFDGHGHMGYCADQVARKMGISREEQDEFAIRSYELTQRAAQDGVFHKEIVGVPVPQRKGDPITVSEDEEYKKLKLDQLKSLKPVFQRDGGTITAGNASSLSDGASALVLMSEKAAKEKGVKPLAKIIGFADAALDPVEFTSAPALAVRKMIGRYGVKMEDISMWEINEAFSSVVLGNQKLLGLDINKVNIHGGAVSIGHPVGMSGARITGHLAHQLQSGQLGIAAVCNGGGGASAILLSKL